MSVLDDDVEKINLKIKEIKSQLPNTDSVCSLLNSCSSCTSNPACGWCSVSQQCVEGDSTGAKDGSCTFYDYGVCSGPRECDVYESCDNCIKDVSCGWCSNPGNPSCMRKDDADKGSCLEDRFVHLWASLNVCPHVNIANFKAITLQALKDNDEVQTVNNSFEMDPGTKKRLMEQLTLYMDEKNKKEVLLGRYLNVANQTEEQINNLEADNLQFNILDDINQDQKDSKYIYLYFIRVLWLLGYRDFGF